ncbi:MAG: LysE family translocator [Oxalobacteraceae bacterium]
MTFSQAELQALQNMWLPIVLYAFVTSASPGPVNIVAVSSGISFGVRRTLPQITGATLGFSLLLFAVGMGLGELLRAAPWLLTFLKIGGSLFLCYLAYKLFQSANATSDINLKKPPSFWDGLLAQWVNPKAWIVAAAGISTYTIPGTAYQMSVIAMALLFLVICFPSITAWAVFGATAKTLLKSQKMIHRFNMVMALLLLLSVLSLIL